MLNRTKYCVANFKMNMKMIDVINYFVEIHKIHRKNLKPDNLYDLSRVIICPPFTGLAAYGAVIGSLINKGDFFNEGDAVALLGAQNVNVNSSGAYTGEISLEMLKDHSVTHIILGHSERREYFSETDKNINKNKNMPLLHPYFLIGVSPFGLVESPTWSLVKCLSEITFNNSLLICPSFPL